MKCNNALACACTFQNHILFFYLQLKESNWQNHDLFFCISSGSQCYVNRLIRNVMYFFWFAMLCISSGSQCYVYLLVRNVMYFFWFAMLCISSGSQCYVYKLFIVYYMKPFNQKHIWFTKLSIYHKCFFCGFMSNFHFKNIYIMFNL